MELGEPVVELKRIQLSCATLRRWEGEEELRTVKPDVSELPGRGFFTTDLA
jgi:hypothetical protein